MGIERSNFRGKQMVYRRNKSLSNERYFLIVNQKYFIVGPASFFNVESIGKGKDLQNTDGFSKLHIQIQMMAWVTVMIMVSIRNRYDDDIW